MNQFDVIKSVRKQWAFNPASRPHSSPKGKKGYSNKIRRQNKIECKNY